MFQEMMRMIGQELFRLFTEYNNNDNKWRKRWNGIVGGWIEYRTRGY